MGKKKDITLRESLANPFIGEDYLSRLEDFEATDLRNNVSITFLDNGYLKISAKNKNKKHQKKTKK